tara:strand:+ start:438 stop:632 length:195 start_codon:yes stop_codon:yes gene_type:complete
MSNFETVHCLKCDDTYSEKENLIVEICPHCGNDDMTETVYLQEEEAKESLRRMINILKNDNANG